MREIGRELKEVHTIPQKSKIQLDEQKQLERMKRLNKIIRLDSCLLIYSYLLLFGSTTPAKLREITGLSKATMFRNLALLYDAHILDKEELKTASDKRYRLRYFISKDLIKATKEFDVAKLTDFAQEMGKLDIITDWVDTIETLPNMLNQHSSQLILNLSQNPSSDAKDDRLVVTKLLSFRVDDVEDLSTLFHHMHEAIGKFDDLKSSKKRNMKKPLRRPVVLSISLTAAGPDMPKLPKGAIVFLKECETLTD